MKQKQLYIIIAVSILSICVVVISSKIRSMSPQPLQSKVPVVQTIPAVTGVSIAPSIEDVKGRPAVGEAKPLQKEPASLSQVYAQYPKLDVGKNMPAAWAKVSPEDKARTYEQLDQQIVQAKETLKINPADKKAKHMLFISETVKKLCNANFDYSLLKSVPREEGGLKSRSKR